MARPLYNPPVGKVPCPVCGGAGSIDPRLWGPWEPWPCRGCLCMGTIYIGDPCADMLMVLAVRMQEGPDREGARKLYQMIIQTPRYQEAVRTLFKRGKDVAP